MYLTKISRQMNHRSVMAGFESVATDTPRMALGILFRVDGDCTIVQSNVPPQQIKDSTVIHYKPEIIEGNFYIFRTAINSVARTNSKERYIEPIEWFQARNLGAEFEIKATEHAPISDRASNGQIVRVNRWNVEGLLKVTDRDTLLTHIKTGLGRGKAWGCGLLSIVPAEKT
jgi:CRISPR system Cascade subunit CasE